MIRSDDSYRPKVQRALPALYEMQFVILGKLTRGKDQAKKQIQQLGGKLETKLSDTILAVISTKNEVEKLNDRMEQAQDLKIHVVSEDFIDEAKDNAGKITDLILKKSICDWGSDVS